MIRYKHPLEVPLDERMEGDWEIYDPTVGCNEDDLFAFMQCESVHFINSLGLSEEQRLKLKEYLLFFMSGHSLYRDKVNELHSDNQGTSENS